MTGRLQGDAAAEWRAHWTVVMAGTAAMAASTINVYSLGLVIEPLQRAFGWSRAEITSGAVIAAVVAVLTGPFTGAAIDRFGPRRIGLFGLSSVCLATVLVSQVGPAIWTWWAVWTLVAIVNAFIQPTLWTAALSSYFRAGRGLAFATALCGSGLGSLTIPIIAYKLIERFGWRGTYIGLALICAVTVLPLVFLFFTSRMDEERRRQKAQPAMLRPERVRRRGDWRPMRSLRFVQLGIAALLIALVVVSFAVSVVPVLTWNGLSRGQAAGIASMLGVTSIIGRLSIGFLLDRFEGRFLAVVSVSLPIISSLILLHAPGSVQAALLAVAILGLALGTELDLVAYLASRYFSLENFGLLFGTIGGGIALAGAVGPWMISYIYDLTHSYAGALWAIIPFCAISALLFLLLGPYPGQVAQQGEARQLPQDAMSLRGERAL